MKKVEKFEDVIAWQKSRLLFDVDQLYQNEYIEAVWVQKATALVKGGFS